MKDGSGEKLKKYNQKFNKTQYNQYIITLNS